MLKSVWSDSHLLEMVHTGTNNVYPHDSAACKCNDIGIFPLSNALSLAHQDRLLGVAVMLRDKVPILHAYLFFMAGSTLFQIYNLVAFAVFPSCIIFSTQSVWITGKSTHVKITTYVFYTKDLHMKKIHFYQHKTVVAPDSSSLQQKKSFDIIEAWHTQDMFSNMAKSITWCSMLIWLRFR